MKPAAAGPNAAAPQPLRAMLDGIDALSRLDGWLGAGCLATLTGLMIAEVAVRALSNACPGCRPTFPSPGNTAPT
jgi:hypothetical protein